MPVSFHIDAARGIVFTTAEGVVTDHDMADYRRRLVVDCNFRPDLDQLSDYRGATEFRVSTKFQAELAARSPFGEGARRAVVADRDEVYGVLRAAETIHSDRPDEFRLFRDMVEARQWLGLDDKSSQVVD